MTDSSTHPCAFPGCKIPCFHPRDYCHGCKKYVCDPHSAPSGDIADSPHGNHSPDAHWGPDVAIGEGVAELVELDEARRREALLVACSRDAGSE